MRCGWLHITKKRKLGLILQCGRIYGNSSEQDSYGLTGKVKALCMFLL